MKHVIIYYFTGTGNAENVAHWVEQIAFKKELTCEIINIASIESFPIEAPANDALLVMISPIHGFNYPPIMVQFISHFPKGNNPVILMNTRAGMLIGKWVTPGLTGIAFYFASLILIFKGYPINGLIPVDMPSNWISLHPSLNDRTIGFIHQKMKAKVIKRAHLFLEGEKTYPAFKEIILDLAIAPISLGYYFIGRFILSKTFFATSDCDNCGACIKKCPVKAITLVNSIPFWKLTCESCMRCMSTCPKRAIESAHGFVLAVALAFNVGLIRSARHFFPEMIEKINPFLFDWVIQALIFIIFITLCYRVMHFMLRFRWFNKLMQYTSLTHYRFWGKRYKAIRGF